MSGPNNSGGFNRKEVEQSRSPRIPEIDEGRETEVNEIQRFSPEATEVLKARGFEIYELTGESIGSLKKKEHPFYHHGWDRDPAWLKSLSSRRMEVAVNPKQFFIPESNNKTLAEQLGMIVEFSNRLQIPGVKVTIGEVPDYTELDFLHLSRTGQHLFKPEEVDDIRAYPDSTRTKTGHREDDFPNNSYTVGFSSQFSYGLIIGSWPVNDRPDHLSIAPLIVPDETVGSEAYIDFGFNKLPGLAQGTMAELARIADRLNNPEKAEFMRKYKLKDSNGAVFWGVPGAGKSLAGLALAEETGCEREIINIDQLMSSYIHGSARELGAKLRELIATSAGKVRPLIVQLDDADTLLRPVGKAFDSFAQHDLLEIRTVLLQVFEEPSNVFFILTTNMDPTNPKEADPAIVRNERLGYLVSFVLPTIEGRLEIFTKEIGKRSGNDLAWEGINFEALASLTEGFAPSDIQAVLLAAANQAYNPKSQSAIVIQQHLEKAINLIRTRKQEETKHDLF